MKSKLVPKLLCAFLTLTLLCGCSAQSAGVMLFSTTAFSAADGTGETAADAPDATLSMTGEEVTTYLGSLEGSETLPLYFKDGNRQIPYLNVESIRELLILMNSQDYSYFPDEIPSYNLTMKTEGNKVVFTRETEYMMWIDFDEDTIYFEDYDKFLQKPYKVTLTDYTNVTGYDQNGNPSLFLRVKEDSYGRYGEEVLLHLGDYGIDLIAENGDYYVPMQTFVDIFCQGFFFLYNGEALFVTTSGEANAYAGGNSSELLEKYYGASLGERSQELITYTYNELCFALDNFYGLKDLHNISSFDNLFTRVECDGKSMKEMLLSSNSRDYDLALQQLMWRDLDDNHSAYILPSAYTGDGADVSKEATYGVSNREYSALYTVYTAARSARYPDGIPGYEEVGNTAYVTFDAFNMNFSEEDLYQNFPTEESNSTIPLIIYAHSRIMREGSPIENVVIDLSCNSGGSIDAAVFTCSWFLGEASIYLKNANTGATGLNAYRCDVNLDRQFDEKDTLEGINLYCLISPVSFSCGNLTPMLLGASNRVTLIGQDSGGGTCLVLPMSTASGTMFQTSGPMTVSVVKNGAYYNVDQGASVDIPLNKVESFFDRVTLTTYLNSHL